VTIVRFQVAQIDSEELTRRIGQRLYGLVDREGRSRLLLDLSEVRYLSSIMLGKLLILKRKAEGAGGRVRLCGLTPSQQTLFEVSRLDLLFELAEDERAALDAFERETGPLSASP
jgi:anti-sigma B factor antagonist